MGKPDLRLRREIRALLKSGRVYRGRLLHVRFGVSALSKTLISIRRKFGSAVDRNRARRRLRDICRSQNLLEPADRLILITVSDRASTATFAEFKMDFNRALLSLGFDVRP